MQSSLRINQFEATEQRHVRSVSLHGVRHNRLGQRLGAARLADQKQRNAQLNTHNHHEDVLLQRLVTSNVLSQLHLVQKHVLAATVSSASLQMCLLYKSIN